MQVVINIPNDEYRLLQMGTTIGSGVDADVCLRKYILDGVVLSEGTTDLISRKTLLDRIDKEREYLLARRVGRG